MSFSPNSYRGEFVQAMTSSCLLPSIVIMKRDILLALYLLFVSYIDAFKISSATDRSSLSWRYQRSTNLYVASSPVTQNKMTPAPKLPDLAQREFPVIPDENELGCNYDLIVIGSGSGGEAGNTYSYLVFKTTIYTDLTLLNM